MQEPALRAELDRLEEAGLVLRKESPPDETYIIKHALIQDAAYGSLLRATRQDYHRKITRVLEEKFPQLTASQPELLARHFEGAAMTPEATTHWAVAGQKAIARSANVEAISAFGNALRLLLSLPASEARDRQEIELRCGLGFALISNKGWAAKDVEETYGPALELCGRYGDLPGRVLYGLWAHYLARADGERAGQLIPRFESMIGSSRHPDDLVTTHGLMSGFGFWTADYPTARHHADLGASYIDRADPRKQAIALLSQGYEGQIYPLLFKAWTDIAQGRARDAVAASEDAINLARASGHPFLMAVSLSYGAAVAHDKHDLDLLEARGRLLAALSSDNAFLFFTITSTSYLGWVAAKRGEIQQGIDMMQQAAGFYQAMGVDLLVAYYLSYVAEGCLDAERVDEGLAAVDHALQFAGRKLTAFCEPELHRLKGDLLILKGDIPEGTRWLRTAHSTAAERRASLFELRATLSLARLWASQGRVADASPMIRASLQAISPDELIPERKQLAELGHEHGLL
jgi:predicted ATPase